MFLRKKRTIKLHQLTIKNVNSPHADKIKIYIRQNYEGKNFYLPSKEAERVS